MSTRAPFWIVIAVAFLGCSEPDYPSECQAFPERCCDLDPTPEVCQKADSTTAETELDTSPAETESDAADTAVVEDTGDAADGETDGTVSDSMPTDGSTDSKPVDTGAVDTGTVDTFVPDVAVDAAVCAASSYSCSGDTLRKCRSDGSAYDVVTTCPSGTCSASLGRCTACTPGTLSCSGTQPTKCDTLGASFAPNGAACVSPQTCGGGGTLGVCGCTPKTDPCAGRTCGSVDNGCGTSVSCGSCTLPRTCGGGGVAGACGGCSGTLPGPTMVDVGGYCVDTSEVTQSQYQTFLTAKGTDTTGQPSTCGFNTTYTPSTTDNCNSSSWTPGTSPNRPVTCVDYCDAFMYCKWAGKRLCGKIGGGAVPYLEANDVTLSQWYRACTTPSLKKFPYGNTYVGGFCNTPGSGSTVDVKSSPSCTGTAAPYSSIYDMSGNASEWEDSCGNLSGTWFCHARGGAYNDGVSTSVQCDDGTVWPMDAKFQMVGFRCCAD